MQLGPASKAKKKGGAGGGLKGMLSKKGPTPAAAVEESKGGAAGAGGMAMNNRDRFGDTYANNTTKKMIALYDYDPQVIIFHRRLITWIV